MNEWCNGDEDASNDEEFQLFYFTCTPSNCLPVRLYASGSCYSCIFWTILFLQLINFVFLCYSTTCNLFNCNSLCPSSNLLRAMVLGLRFWFSMFLVVLFAVLCGVLCVCVYVFCVLCRLLRMCVFLVWLCSSISCVFLVIFYGMSVFWSFWIEQHGMKFSRDTTFETTSLLCYCFWDTSFNMSFRDEVFWEDTVASFGFETASLLAWNSFGTRLSGTRLSFYRIGNLSACFFCVRASCTSESACEPREYLRTHPACLRTHSGIYWDS